MKRDTEIELAKELIALFDSKTPFLDPQEATSPVIAYTCKDRFDAEINNIFRRFPILVAHSSELPEKGAFFRCEFAGLPLLLTRDESLKVHAFLNVCRHRGTRLVDEDSGCKKRFSCPYHAWTWSNKGELIAIPGKDHGFPGLSNKDLGLTRRGAVEKYGWIWVNPADSVTPDLESHLGELSQDLDWIEADQHLVLHSNRQSRAANWKILTEGGLEAYHFKVAHRKTIGPS